MHAKLIITIAAVVVLVTVLIAYSVLVQHEPKPVEQVEKKPMQQIEIGERMQLPAPRSDSETSVEEALVQRRSIRDYADENLTFEELSQLLWAAQGRTAPWGGRTAPSAGALYPLELYVVVGAVDGLESGVYRYRPHEHELEKLKDGDVRAALADAALGQGFIREAAIDIVFAAVYERTTVKYRGRGIRYVYMEAGHAAQNVYLQAVALDLGTVTVGAFFDEDVSAVVGLHAQENPLYIMPVGRKG